MIEPSDYSTTIRKNEVFPRTSYVTIRMGSPMGLRLAGTNTMPSNRTNALADRRSHGYDVARREHQYMAYRLSQRDSLEIELRKVIRRQIEHALRALEGFDRDRGTAVHEARRACKRLRGALRLFRPALGGAFEVENVRYRDAARVLGRLRDRHVLAVVFDGLQRGQRRDRALRTAIHQPRARQAPSRAVAARMALNTVDDFRARLLDGLVHVDALTLPSSAATVVEPGFAATYRACRRGLKRCRSSPTDSNLHEWRKSVKYHACHLLLIRGLSRRSVKGRAQSCEALGETLGDDHDLALLASVIRRLRRNLRLRASADRVLDLIFARRERLQRRAFSLGDDLFVHPTEAFARSWLRPRIRRTSC